MDFDRLIDRSNTGACKWMKNEDKSLTGAKVIPLTIADMEFASPQCIVKSIKKRLDKEIFGYTLMTEEYKNRVIAWYRKRFNWNIEECSLYISHGVIDGFKKCIDSVCAEDERVIIQTPSYPPFFSVNRQVIHNPLIYDKMSESFVIDYEHLEMLAQDKKNTVLLFCHPHNPTGRVWKESELIKVADICFRNGVTIISDEIHSDLVRQGVVHTPFLKLCPDGDIITCVAPSKTFNIAGLDTAHIVVNESMKGRLKKAYCSTMINPLSMAAIEGAYSNEGEEWLESLKKYVDGNMEYVKERLSAELSGIGFNVPEGTYLAWLNMKKYVKDTEDFASKCLEYGRVQIEDGERFGTAGFVRLNLACPRDMLAEAMNRFIATVKRYYTL